MSLAVVGRLSARHPLDGVALDVLSRPLCLVALYEFHDPNTAAGVVDHLEGTHAWKTVTMTTLY